MCEQCCQVLAMADFFTSSMANLWRIFSCQRSSVDNIVC